MHRASTIHFEQSFPVRFVQCVRRIGERSELYLEHREGATRQAELFLIRSVGMPHGLAVNSGNVDRHSFEPGTRAAALSDFRVGCLKHCYSFVQGIRETPLPLFYNRIALGDIFLSLSLPGQRRRPVKCTHLTGHFRYN